MQQATSAIASKQPTMEQDCLPFHPPHPSPLRRAGLRRAVAGDEGHGSEMGAQAVDPPRGKVQALQRGVLSREHAGGGPERRRYPG